MTGSAKLKDLNISYNKITAVEPTILARAVKELARIDLGNTELTKLQIETLFKALNDDSKLKWMSINNNDLSMVDPNLLAKTVCRLEVVNLKRTNINIHQLSSIFTLVPQTSRVTAIFLDTDLVRKVDPQIIENSKLYFSINNISAEFKVC